MLWKAISFLLGSHKGTCEQEYYKFTAKTEEPAREGDSLHSRLIGVSVCVTAGTPTYIDRYNTSPYTRRFSVPSFSAKS